MYQNKEHTKGFDRFECEAYKKGRVFKYEHSVWDNPYTIIVWVSVALIIILTAGRIPEKWTLNSTLVFIFCWFFPLDLIYLHIKGLYYVIRIIITQEGIITINRLKKQKFYKWEDIEKVQKHGGLLHPTTPRRYRVFLKDGTEAFWFEFTIDDLEDLLDEFRARVEVEE